MNLDMFDRRRAERFAQLLDGNNGGLRHHARGQADEQLAELVAIGHTLSAVRPAIQVDAEFRTGLRAMLVATAERDGIGEESAIETAPGSHVAIRESRLTGLAGRVTGRRVRARGAIVIGVAAGALAVSGISAASDNAVPGDVFYGVKRSTERAQLAMAGSDVTRGQLSLDFARTRLAEAAALDGDDPGFAGVLHDMDNDTRQGVRLLTASAVTRRDATTLATVDAFVAGQRRVITPLLDRLDVGNRERAMVSVGLLNEITRRAEGLRAALQCADDQDAVSGTDSLGPRPRACGVAADSTGPDNQRQGQAEQAEPDGTTTNGRTPPKATPTTGTGPNGEPATDGGAPDQTGRGTSGVGPAPAGDPEPADSPRSHSGDQADPDDGTPDEGGGLLPDLPLLNPVR